MFTRLVSRALSLAETSRCVLVMSVRAGECGRAGGAGEHGPALGEEFPPWHPSDWMEGKHLRSWGEKAPWLGGDTLVRQKTFKRVFASRGGWDSEVMGLYSESPCWGPWMEGMWASVTLDENTHSVSAICKQILREEEPAPFNSSAVTGDGDNDNHADN